MGTLHQYLEESAKKSPEIEAIVSASCTFTYKELDERTNQLAAFMVAAGLKKGDLVGILCKNDHPYPTILLAIMKIGAVAIPLNWRLTGFELAGILQIAKPKLMFYDQDFEEAVALIREQGLVERLVIAGNGLEMANEYVEIFTRESMEPLPKVAMTGDDLAVILFTSGTTGTPKGCMISHGCYDTYLSRSRARTEHARFLAVHPLFHMSSTSLIFYNVYNGNTMVMLADGDTTSILKTIEAEKIQSMFAFPSVYSYLLGELERKEWDISSLKFVSTGGTKASPALIRRFLELGIPMTQGYGSTEAAFVSGWHPIMGMEYVDSVGRPFLDVQVKILDPETGEEVPAGQVGEVAIKSPYLFKGYLHNPEATAKVLIDGWYHMGDAGRLDEEGFLYISGRYKEMILVGGDNVYPIEVEDLIDHIPDVMEVAVVGVAHETLGEVPRAYVVKKQGSPLTEEEIVEACRQKLAAYKIPEVVFVSSLPVNGLGKVMKHLLKQ
ncbi:class I adenylate-forming enzyme family protein [Brevibacillus centrosporus]|uniref:class I adenylate-forming enzyme family protein n=1 Tax=Brevibacillus centrosporus TaxID=54910 RepID=UPI000F09E05D|nr:class I adenylate-forming enzyme family protein [Brevibacillus centrosporus]MEC2131739.1 class I adenylate-forming enzyme family protein [Brevibacillus centrosporus]RNB67386.1 long-chain fatty acid--CoA ligase [Brevibacillus centrosporus]GED34393.1 acyl--CoA ligase [Brevibacillus centrosporus]